MKKFAATLITSFALASIGVSVYAAELVIGAGSESGEYTNTIVPAINTALEGQDLTAKAMVSQGSQENIAKLINGDLDAALVQLDVLAMNIEAASAAGLELVDVITPEALLCAVHKEGRVRSYYNLTDDQLDKPLVVSIGAELSGTAQSLPYILAMDPDFDDNNVDFVYGENIEAELDRLAGGSRDMVCFVMMANPKNPLIAKVNDDDQLEFIDFVSAYALENKVGESNVYESSVVPVSDGLWGFRAAKVETLVTWVALVVSNKVDDVTISALTTALAKPDLLPPTTAAGKAKRLYGDFKDKAKTYTAKAKEKALMLKDKAKEKTSELTEMAKEKTAGLREKAGELTEKAKEKAGELTEKAMEKASELKEKAKEATSQQ